VFLVAAPGVVGGLVPWLLTGYRTTHPPAALAVLGAVLLAVGAGVLLVAVHGRRVHPRRLRLADCVLPPLQATRARRAFTLVRGDRE
jgi:hypothetical protein